MAPITSYNFKVTVIVIHSNNTTTLSVIIESEGSECCHKEDTILYRRANLFKGKYHR
jgi:hypothetical protein